MLQPKKTKYRKMHKKRKPILLKQNKPEPKFGDIALQITQPGIITAKQIEICRRTLTSSLNRQGKVWLRIFPDQPQTKKPNEVRMGRGKGDVKEWGAKVRPGKVFVEITGADPIIMKRALKKIQYKLPVTSRILTRIV